MINREFFFHQARTTLFDGTLKQKQVDGLNAILDCWDKNLSEHDDRWLAYALATAHHETDRTMQPIEEYGKGKGHKYGERFKTNGQPYSNTPAIFYGRGLVQLTWYENYELAGQVLGEDLLHHPELALRPDLACAIMFDGMMEGWFTAKKLSDYFAADKSDWVNARRIINGLDKANLIAGYGMKYYACISHTV